jgi:hypothetical protein
MRGRGGIARSVWLVSICQLASCDAGCIQLGRTSRLTARQARWCSRSGQPRSGHATRPRTPPHAPTVAEYGWSSIALAEGHSRGVKSHLALLQLSAGQWFRLRHPAGAVRGPQAVSTLSNAPGAEPCVPPSKYPPTHSRSNARIVAAYLNRPPCVASTRTVVEQFGCPPRKVEGAGD